jgi:hypothetical protein
VGDHEHRQVQAVGQVLDQGVEGRGADRVQARGGLVQEQQLGVHGQGAGQAGALAHAARQLGGLEVAGPGGQADQGDLQVGQVLDLALGQAGVLVQRRGDVLAHGQVREQRPLLEQHAPAALDDVPAAARGVGHVLAEQLDRAAVGDLQADDGVEQDRLAGARAADHAQHLAALGGQVQAVVDDVVAEPRDQAGDPDRRRLGGRRASSSARGGGAVRSLAMALDCDDWAGLTGSAPCRSGRRPHRWR